MKTIEEYTNLSIPSDALSYLVNGDSSGIDADDMPIPTNTVDLENRILSHSFNVPFLQGKYTIYSRAYHPYKGLLVDVWNYDKASTQRVTLAEYLYADYQNWQLSSEI